MLEIEKRQLLDERQEKVKGQAQLRLTISDFETNPETSGTLKARIDKELKELLKEIAKTRKEHEALRPQLEQANTTTNALQDK